MMRKKRKQESLTVLVEWEPVSKEKFKKSLNERLF